MLPVGMGIACGLVAALALARLMSSLLFEVEPFDPATFLITPALLLVVALAAICVPGRRAQKVDPIAALRSG